MQSQLIFGNGNGQQSNYNNLAQYLASPPGDQSSEAEVEKKKWMLATGLGGMFTPGKSCSLLLQQIHRERRLMNRTQLGDDRSEPTRSDVTYAAGDVG